MKILVMQLARYGDIFQTWPTLKSLKRNHPQAEIHFLCRDSFAVAAQNLPAITRVWKLDVASHIQDVIEQNEAPKKMASFLEEIKNESFDRLINLSFSPVSSYMTDFLTEEKTKISGYTRHEDGYLNIPDDPSALFYGQVGVNKYNRIHVTRLFSAVAEVDLIEDDWKVDEALLAVGALKFPDLPRRYVTIHIGGSTDDKRLTPHQWNLFLEGLHKKSPEINIVLLGGPSEVDFANQLIVQNSEKMINLVGQTELVDLFYIIDKSEALIAPDSSLVHISSLLNKRCFNFSFSSINFWETGPLAKKSHVFWSRTPPEVDISLFIRSVLQFISEEVVDPPFIRVHDASEPESYEISGYQANEFQWKLIKAIYLGSDFPILDDIKVYTAFKQLAELTDMVLRDLEMVRQGQFQNIPLEIVNNVEQLILTLEKMVPEVRPIIWWFNTERSRIGPGADQVVFDRNYEVFNQLRSILAMYVGTNSLSSQLESGL